MHTKESFASDLRSLGIEKDDLLTVHTSLKAIGKIDDSQKSGAEVLIDALRESVSDGILFIPSHTFKNLRETFVFDIRNTLPCIGVLPCVAVEMANKAYDSGDKTCVRSMQASHSVVAFGKDAYEFVKADRNTVTRTPLSGCYGHLLRENGKILLVGVDLSRNTFIHAIDEELEPEVYETQKITLVDYDGKRIPYERQITKGPAAASFVRYTQPLVEAGAVTKGKVGDAEALLVDAKLCYEVVTGIRKKELLK